MCEELGADIEDSIDRELVWSFILQQQLYLEKKSYYYIIWNGLGGLDNKITCWVD